MMEIIVKNHFDDESFQYVPEVEFPLDSFREYLNITQDVIEKEVKQKISAYERYLDTASDEEIKRDYDFIDHEIRINTQQLFYNSLFISAYSLLEKKMSQLCKVAGKRYTLQARDISGEGIFRYRTYLEKVVGIDFTNLKTEWDQITRYNKLRNHLVHSPTITIVNVGDSKGKIEILKGIREITIIDKGDLVEFEIGDKKFLIHFLNLISTFLREIYYVKA
jgi:hypothetical protein